MDDPLERGVGADQGQAREALGERWALVAPHRDRLVRMLRSRCVDDAEAEDCAHEALLDVVTHPRLDPSRVGGLLTVVGRRLAVDRHRRRTRLQSALARTAVDGVVAADELALERVAARDLAGQAVRLPATERAVLALRAAGYSPLETSDRLGISYAAAATAMCRARERLRVTIAVGATIVVGLLRRLARPAPATAVAGVAAAALLLPRLLLGPVDPGMSSPAPAAAHPAPLHAAAALVAPSRVGSPTAGHGIQPPGPRSGGRAPSGRGGGTPPVVVRAPLAAGGASDTVTVTVSNPDEPPTDPILRCLQRGPSLALDHLGCPP